MRGILGRYRSIRLEQFTLVLFEILFGCLLLSSAIQTVIPILYWMGVSLLIVKLTRDTYEKPLEELAEASKKVAQGDLSVYVPPVHRVDQPDYMGRMIRNLNKMVAELGALRPRRPTLSPTSLTRSRRPWR